MLQDSPVMRDTPSWSVPHEDTPGVGDHGHSCVTRGQLGSAVNSQWTEVKEGQPEADMGRTLGGQEKLYYDLYTTHDGESFLLYALIVETPLQPLQADTVQLALEQLQRESAMLRTRVEPRSDGLYLVPMEQPRVDFQVLPPGQDWLETYHQLLNTDHRVDPHSGPMWSAKLMNDPANTLGRTREVCRAMIIIESLHVIGGGIAITEAFGRLVELLDALIRGTSRVDEVKTGLDWPPPPLQKIPPSIEELLGDQLRDLKIVEEDLGDKEPSRRFLDRYVKPYRPELAAQYRNAIIPRLLSAECFSRFRAKCRERGITVNSAMMAATALATVQMMPQDHGGAQSVLVTAVVNARRYVIKEMVHACLSRGLLLRRPVLVGTSDVSQFWSVAEVVDADMKRHLKLKTAMEFLKQGPLYDDDTAPDGEPMENNERSPLWSRFMLNNLGSLDAAIPQTAGVKPIQLFHHYQCNPSSFDIFCSVCFQTVGGQLCLNTIHIPGRVEVADVEEFTDRVVDIVQSATSS